MAVVPRLHIFEQSSIPPISKFTNILYYQSNASITLQWQKNAENVLKKSNIIYSLPQEEARTTNLI